MKRTMILLVRLLETAMSSVVYTSCQRDDKAQTLTDDGADSASMSLFQKGESRSIVALAQNGPIVANFFLCHQVSLRSTQPNSFRQGTLHKATLSRGSNSGGCLEPEFPQTFEDIAILSLRRCFQANVVKEGVYGHVL